MLYSHFYFWFIWIYYRIYHCMHLRNCCFSSVRKSQKYFFLKLKQNFWRISALKRSNFIWKICRRMRIYGSSLNSMNMYCIVHSVLEQIWMKGSYLTNDYHRVKGDPLRSQNHDELKSSTVGPTNKNNFQSFFQTNIFFFRNNFFFQGTTFVYFFMYCKAKKKIRRNPKFFENFWFSKVIR